MSKRHYTFRAEWSPEDEEYVGLVAEFPSLSWLAPTAGEAMVGIEQLVNEVVEDMESNGEPVPAALADRRYSGKIALRTSPDLHRRLAIEAAEQHVSLNQWVVQKLTQPIAAPVPAEPRPQQGSSHSREAFYWRPLVNPTGGWHRSDDASGEWFVQLAGLDRYLDETCTQRSTLMPATFEPAPGERGRAYFCVWLRNPTEGPSEVESEERDPRGVFDPFAHLRSPNG